MTLRQVAEARQRLLLVRHLVEVVGRHQPGIDVALELRGVDGEEVEVLAFAALDLGPDLVVGADEDDVDVGAGLRLEFLDPVVVGIALPGQDAQLLGEAGRGSRGDAASAAAADSIVLERDASVTPSVR